MPSASLEQPLPKSQRRPRPFHRFRPRPSLLLAVRPPPLDRSEDPEERSFPKAASERPRCACSGEADSGSGVGGFGRPRRSARCRGRRGGARLGRGAGDAATRRAPEEGRCGVGWGWRVDGVGVGGGSGVGELRVRVPSGCWRPGLPGPTPGWLLPPRLLRDGDLGRGRVRAPAAGGGAAAVAARLPGADSFAPGKDGAARGWGCEWAGREGARARSLGRGAGRPAPSAPGLDPPRTRRGTVRPTLATFSSPGVGSFLGWGHGSCPEFALAQACASDPGAERSVSVTLQPQFLGFLSLLFAFLHLSLTPP